jgi:hypothetical protein
MIFYRNWDLLLKDKWLTDFVENFRHKTTFVPLQFSYPEGSPPLTFQGRHLQPISIK